MTTNTRAPSLGRIARDERRGTMDTVGLALIDTAEAEERRHNQYQASSLADHMTSFQRFLNAAIAVQTHFNLPTDGTPYTWDELRQMAQLSAHAGNSTQDETGEE